MSDRLIAAVDFETFYDSKDGYTLREQTPVEYVNDPRFNAYLVAVAFSDGRPSFVGNPKNFDWHSLDDALLLAHNATFDGMVLRRLEQLGIVDERPREWLDTADLTAYLGVTRNLKNACKELLGRNISKEVRTAMDGKTDRDLHGAELDALLKYGASDAEECLEIFLKFQHLWPQIERDISNQNREAVWRGIYVDVKALDNGIAALEKVRADAVANLPWVDPRDPDRSKPAGSLPALRNACEKAGLPVPPSFRKNDPKFLAWQAEYADKAPFLAARIKYASATPNLARLVNLRKHLPGGLYHSDIRYFGTHTGRTASGAGGETSASKMNLLNLPKAKVFGVDMRGIFIPRPGHKFIIYDYGQIEARVIKWIARDFDFVEALKTEGNIYQAEAVKMGWAKPGGPSLKHTDKNLYQLAKACVLGLGYGMSAARFVDTCKGMGLSLDPVPRDLWPETFSRRHLFMMANALEIYDPYSNDPKTIERVGEFLRSDQIVSQWRNANPKILAFWDKLNRLLTQRAEEGVDVAYFRLPSGRLKPYYRPRFESRVNTSYDIDAGKRVSSARRVLTAAVIRDRPSSVFHGGSLAENYVQATSRDIMAQCAVDVERLYPKCKYMWSCYDEIIFEVLEEDAEEMNRLIPEVMTHGPSISEWIDDKLPLEVEGGIFDRYCK